MYIKNRVDQISISSEKIEFIKNVIKRINMKSILFIIVPQTKSK